MKKILHLMNNPDFQPCHDGDNKNAENSSNDDTVDNPYSNHDTSMHTWPQDCEESQSRAADKYPLMQTSSTKQNSVINHLRRLKHQR